MSGWFKKFDLVAIITFCLLNGFGQSNTAIDNQPEVRKYYNKSIVQVLIQPDVTRFIGGYSQLDRKKYFNLCDHGSDFDIRASKKIYSELITDCGVYFGRRLGCLSRWATDLNEDVSRPGFADLTKLKLHSPPRESDLFREAMGSNLDVACHGNHNKYPAYMGKYFKGSSNYHGTPEWLPKNLDAAAELAASILKYNFTDFDRPAYFEPLNEPHWEFWKDPHLVNWHIKTKNAVSALTPSVQVGGPCLSVAYFYRDNYKLFSGLKYFMDETDGEMDFYSFHAYDFFRWNGNEFHGRIQSGLPLEGILDLVQNYAYKQFGEEKKIVLSEHGGYIIRDKGIYDGEAIASEIANAHFHGDSFENEIKKRSIVNTLMIQSIMANTLTFMDHPHVIQKAVPFVLPKSWKWDKKYYAQLYVPYNYSDTSREVPTHLVNFFRFFRGVEGRRVKALSNDPDVQVRAFVKGDELFLILNNLSHGIERVSLKGFEIGNAKLRRLGRNKDFTGFYTEQDVSSLNSVEISGLEAVLIHCKKDQEIRENRQVYEEIFYGNKVAVPLADGEFIVDLPKKNNFDYAQLRVGLTRNVGSNYHPIIKLNGKELDVPLEDCAQRLTDKEYATTKIFLVNTADLTSRNRISVTFADNSEGAIGSVVLRAGLKKKRI